MQVLIKEEGFNEVKIEGYNLLDCLELYFTQYGEFGGKISVCDI